MMTSITILLVELLFWALLYRFGVPLNYLVAFACTSSITKGLYSIHQTLSRTNQNLQKEMILQTRILAKHFNIDEGEVMQELTQEFIRNQEKKNAVNQ